MSTVGENLLAWRRSRGLTQENLSREAGIPQPNLCALEGNRSDPSLTTLRRVAAALNITVGQLIDQRPEAPNLDRHAIDRIARHAVGLREDPAESSQMLTPWELQISHGLAHLASERLAAAGQPRIRQTGTGVHIYRRLKAELGPALWDALLRRLDKHLGGIHENPRH